MLQNKKPILFVLAAVVAMAAGIFFRLYPLITQGKQEAQNLAAVIVLGDLRQKMQKYIEINFPKLSDVEKMKLSEANFQAFIRDNRKQIAPQIEEGAEKILENRPADTPQYMLEADSYYFYGLTENIKDYGSISKEMKRGKFFNPLMLAPHGNWQPFCLHPYLGFYLYKIASFFNPDVEMISALLYTVIIFAALCVIPFLLICYILGLSPLASFIGSLFFLLSPFYTQRTAYGWYDTDVYSILLPLSILFFIFLAFDQKRGAKSRTLCFGAAAFFTAAYELLWEGWGFVCVILLLALPLIALVNKLLARTDRNRPIFIGTGIYLAASLLLISIFNSPFAIIDTFRESWKMLNSFLVSKFDLWPNIFLTVGETQPMSIPKISFLIFGNILLLYLAILGPIIFLIKAFIQKNLQRIYSGIVLAIFSGIFLYLSVKSARNALLLTVPLTLGLALTLDMSYAALKKLIASVLAKKSRLAAKITGILLSLLLFSAAALPLYAAYQICSRIYPIYNRTWDKVLNQLRNDTPEDSIINTWWCPGHFITSVAKRSVISDGATQHLPQTYWMATILMANDEKYAMGLLRMLNLSGNKALDYLQDTCRLPVSEGISLLKEIAPLSKKDAATALQRKIGKEETAEILRMTHGTPRPAYFMIYTDLVDTYLALPFFGNWDFKKAEYLLSINKNSKQKIKIPSRSSKDKYIDFLWSLSGGVPPVSPQYPQIYRSKDMVVFENRFVVDLNSMECFLLSPDATKFVNPKSIIYVKNDELKEKSYPGNTLPFSLLLLEKDDAYKSIILDSTMAKSLLFRLYYLNGKGLAAFEPYLREEDPMNNTAIVVYKINWDY